MFKGESDKDFAKAKWLLGLSQSCIDEMERMYDWKTIVLPWKRHKFNQLEERSRRYLDEVEKIERKYLGNV